MKTRITFLTIFVVFWLCSSVFAQTKETPENVGGVLSVSLISEMSQLKKQVADLKSVTDQQTIMVASLSDMVQKQKAEIKILRDAENKPKETEWRSVQIAEASLLLTLITAGLATYIALKQISQTNSISKFQEDSQHASADLLRKQNTFNLNEKWETDRFSKFRSLAWDTLKDEQAQVILVKWASGQYDSDVPGKSPRILTVEKIVAIRSVLNFFVSLSEYNECGLTDPQITKQLFSAVWAWWSPLFAHLGGKVNEEISKSPQMTLPYLYPRLQKVELIDKMMGINQENEKKC